MHALLQRIVLASARRYRVVFLVALVAAAAAGGLITRIHLDTDILNLLPKHEPKVQHFLEAMERFGGVAPGGGPGARGRARRALHLAGG